MDESRKREQDADLDRKDMSSVRTTGMDQLSEKQAQVVSEKATDVDLPNLVQDFVNAASEERRIALLPSYLTIDQKSEIIKGPLIREYVRKSERDPEEQVGWAFVYSGTWLGCNFAFKVFKCGADPHWNERQLLMEVGNLVELRHPHVVRLVGFGHDDEECVFVMELMDGNLRSCIDAKPFTASETLDIITQIAKGMCFMHTKGYAHGDLKCSNLLVKKFGESQEVKISDLRGSQSLDKAWDPEAFRQARLTRRPRWTAPEAIDHYNGVQPPTELLKQSDVYSFGMACYRFAKAQHVPQIPGRRGNEPGKVEFFRSNSVVIVPDHLMIKPEQLARSVTPIGEGSHGRVFKATWLGCTFAVKIQLCSATTLVLQQEVDFLVNVSRHPCIVQNGGFITKP